MEPEEALAKMEQLVRERLASLAIPPIFFGKRLPTSSGFTADQITHYLGNAAQDGH